MQWKYLAFRWHAAARGVMDQRLFRGLNFFDSAWAGLLVRQAEQQSAGRQDGWASEYQVCLKASDSLALHEGVCVGGGGVSRGCKECQWEPSCPGSSNWLNRPLVSWLWLAESLSTQKWLIRQYSKGEGGVFPHRPDKKRIFMCFTRIQEARTVSTLCNTTPPPMLFLPCDGEMRTLGLCARERRHPQRSSKLWGNNLTFTFHRLQLDAYNWNTCHLLF